MMTWLMDRVDLYKLEEMSMKGSGSTIRQKVRESTSTKMALHTLDSGITINNMAMVMKNGQMEQNTKVVMLRE